MTSTEVRVVEPPPRWPRLNLQELYVYRGLFWVLAARDVRVRYKQTILGGLWAVLQPLLTMAVFTVLFSSIMGKEQVPTTPGVPYSISTYVGLVPWFLFANAVAQASDGLVANRDLITKVYFPRLIAPLAPIVTSTVDFAFSFTVLIALMGAYALVGDFTFSPGPALLTLPLFAAFAILAAVAVSLWLSALNALYRDVRHAIPFLLRIWMFVSPTVYTTASAIDAFPPWARILYALNPMSAVIEGFRWALLHGPPPRALDVTLSLLSTLLTLAAGLLFFRRVESAISDVI